MNKKIKNLLISVLISLLIVGLLEIFVFIPEYDRRVEYTKELREWDQLTNTGDPFAGVEGMEDISGSILHSVPSEPYIYDTPYVKEQQNFVVLFAIIGMIILTLLFYFIIGYIQKSRKDLKLTDANKNKIKIFFVVIIVIIGILGSYFFIKHLNLTNEKNKFIGKWQYVPPYNSYDYPLLLYENITFFNNGSVKIESIINSSYVESELTEEYASKIERYYVSWQVFEIYDNNYVCLIDDDFYHIIKEDIDKHGVEKTCNKYEFDGDNTLTLCKNDICKTYRKVNV